MARKKRDDEQEREREDAEPEEEAAADDDTDEDEALEEELTEDAEADLEEEPADDETDRDEEPRDEEPVDAEESAREPVPPDDEEEAEDVEAPPRARTPMFTIVLLLLNLLVAPIFVLLLLMDYNARQQWSYATFLNKLAVLGLPLNEEEAAASAWYQTRPRLRIDGDRLKDAYGKRPRVPGTPGITEQFQPVDTIDEPLSFRIQPSQIDKQVKDDLFGKNGLSDPVSTLNEEVDRLKRTVPQAIQDAAAKYVDEQKTADKKVAALEKILLPLTWSTAPVLDSTKETSKSQVQKLQERIDKAKGNEAELNELLKDAVERRLLTDLLAPVNIYRPGNIEKFQVEKVADLDTYKLDELRDLLQKRFDDAIGAQHIGEVHAGNSFDGKPNDSIEKRHAIAFLMVALSQLRVPGAQEPLFPKGFERAQVVNGLYEFTVAAANYPRTLKVLEKRVVDAIIAEREGYVVTEKDTGKVVTRTESGFADQLGAEIERLKKVKAGIVFTQKRYQHLIEQRDRYSTQYNERLELLTEVAKKLVDAKVETQKLRDEVRILNEEQFKAQKYLGTAADENAQLAVKIVEAERELLPKGGTKR